jgi:hypothetical protein
MKNGKNSTCLQYTKIKTNSWADFKIQFYSNLLSVCTIEDLYDASNYMWFVHNLGNSEKNIVTEKVGGWKMKRIIHIYSTQK